MVVRSSLAMLVMAVLAVPLVAQEQGAPSGRQELAEQQQGQDVPAAQGAQQQGAQQQGQAQQGQARQAQPRQGQAQQGRPRTAVARASGEVDHRQLAEMFILSNQAEVELGNLALEKSQNEQVREFAQMMVKDHTAAIAKLQKFAGSGNQAAPQTGAVRPRNTTGARQQANSGHDGMMDFHRKSCQLELAMTKQMLSRYEGQDFDMGYLGQQMVAHTKMLACLTTAKDYGPEDFQKTIEEAITTTREHMQHGQQIAAKFEDKEYGEGPRRESARPDLRQDRERPDGAIRDGGARPAIRAEDADAPRVDTPREGAPRVRPSTRDEGQTDGAPDSARDREEAVP